MKKYEGAVDPRFALYAMVIDLLRKRADSTVNGVSLHID